MDIESDYDSDESEEETSLEFANLKNAIKLGNLERIQEIIETTDLDIIDIKISIDIAIKNGKSNILRYFLEDQSSKLWKIEYNQMTQKRFVFTAIINGRTRLAAYLIDMLPQRNLKQNNPLPPTWRDELQRSAFSFACKHNQSYATDLIKQGVITQFTKQHLRYAIVNWERKSDLFEHILSSHQIDPTSGYDEDNAQEAIPAYFPFVLALEQDLNSAKLCVRILTFLLSKDFMAASNQAHGTRINPGFHGQFLLDQMSSLGDEGELRRYNDDGPIDLSFIRYLFQEDRLLIPKYQSTNANPDTTWGIDPDSPFQPNVLHMFARYGTKEDHDVLIGDSFRFAFHSYNMNWMGRRNGIPDPNDTQTTYNLPLFIAINYNQPEVVQWWLDRFVTKTSLNSQWIPLFESAVQYGRADNLEVLYTNYKKQYDLVASAYQPYQQSPIVLIPPNLHWVKTFETQKHELMVRMFDGFLKPVDTTPPGEIMDETSATYGYGIEPNFTHVMVLLLVWGWVDQIEKVYSKLPSKLKKLTDDGSRVFLNIHPWPLLLYGTWYNYPIGRFCQKVEAKVKEENIQGINLAFAKQIHPVYQAFERNPPDVNEQFIQYHLGHLDPLEAQAWGMYYLFVVVQKKQLTVKLFMQLATRDVTNLAFQTYLSRGGAVVLAKFRQSQSTQSTSLQQQSFQQQYRPDGWDAERNSWKQCVPCTNNEFQQYEARYQETGIGNPCRFTRTTCNEHIGQSRTQSKKQRTQSKKQRTQKQRTQSKKRKLLQTNDKNNKRKK